MRVQLLTIILIAVILVDVMIRISPLLDSSHKNLAPRQFHASGPNATPPISPQESPKPKPPDETAANGPVDKAEVQQFEEKWHSAHSNLFVPPQWEESSKSERIQREMMAQFANVSVVYTWVNLSDPMDLGGRAMMGRPWPPYRLAMCREDLQLRYSVRAFERFMSWHQGTVYLVTPGYWPEWLNHSHPRLRCIDQATLVKTPDNKPFFNSNALELHLDLIPGISPYFIHMNDDYLFLRAVHPWDFFLPGGGLQLFMGPAVNLWNTASLIEKRTLERSHWRGATAHSWDIVDKVFGRTPRYMLKHSPFAYHTSIMSRVRVQWPHEVAITVSHPFRKYSDVISPILHHALAIHEGAKYGVKAMISSGQHLQETHQYLAFESTFSELAAELERLTQDPNVQFLTVNGKCKSSETRKVFYKWLDKRYPQPSSFELQRH